MVRDLFFSILESLETASPVLRNGKINRDPEME